MEGENHGKSKRRQKEGRAVARREGKSYRGVPATQHEVQKCRLKM